MGALQKFTGVNDQAVGDIMVRDDETGWSEWSGGGDYLESGVVVEVKDSLPGHGALVRVRGRVETVTDNVDSARALRFLRQLHIGKGRRVRNGARD